MFALTAYTLSRQLGLLAGRALCIASQSSMLCASSPLSGHPDLFCLQYMVVVVGTMADGTTSEKSNAIILTTPAPG